MNQRLFNFRRGRIGKLEFVVIPVLRVAPGLAAVRLASIPGLDRREGVQPDA